MCWLAAHVHQETERKAEATGASDESNSDEIQTFTLEVPCVLSSSQTENTSSEVGSNTWRDFFNNERQNDFSHLTYFPTYLWH